ncbi:MAG: sulfite exporter TauE/SafE family protein [Microgenomates group bacterium]
MSLLLVFLTGLTTGGLSCLAMQGGLLASVIANQKDNFSLKSSEKLDWMPVAMFLIAKLISHTLLGALLGLLGSAMTLSLGMKLGFQTFTAIFMFATAMNLLDVHPVFRNVVFKPPKCIQRMIRKSGKSTTLFAPAVLGAMTIFIPCGVTQAMEVLAINSGNALSGALIMFSFVLGTSPLFALVGVATAKLTEGWYQKFTKIASIVLIVMAVFSINGVLLVIDAPITLNKIVRPITYFFSEERFSKARGVAEVVNGQQQVTIGIFNSGYSPNYVRVQAGVPVNLTLVSKDTYSCALAFVFREFNINTFLEATDTQSFTFTPQKPGKYTFACSMGMYTGTLEVI